MAKTKKWAQKASARMEKKGTKGSLTRAAHKAGYKSALPYAHHIQANPEDYSGKMRKKANFAVNINGGEQVLNTATSQKARDLIGNRQFVLKDKKAFRQPHSMIKRPDCM